MSAPDMLEAALDLVREREFSVFPVHYPIDAGTERVRCSCGRDCGRDCGKHPMTAHGFKDATTDEDQIRAWWTRWPLANIGVATGAVSGIVVLDVDTSDEKHGDRTLVDLIQKHGPIGPTLHAITGSGGDHYYFAHPGERVPNSTSAIGPGLDVRGDGGFVVAAPSLHASGGRYSWSR